MRLVYQPFALPAWEGTAGALGVSINEKGARSVFYLGTDGELYQVTEDGSDDTGVWPSEMTWGRWATALAERIRPKLAHSALSFWKSTSGVFTLAPRRCDALPKLQAAAWPGGGHPFPAARIRPVHHR